MKLMKTFSLFLKRWKGILYDSTQLIKPSREEKQFMEMHVNPHAGENILDAGGGTGMFSIYLAQAKTNVVNTDICKGFLYQAHYKSKKKGLSINLVLASLSNLPYQNEVFDKIICFDTMHHIQVDRLKTLEEFHRVLKIGGKIIFRDPLRHEKGFNRYKIIDLSDFFYQNEMTPGDSKKYKRVYWSKEEYLINLKKAGFSSVRINGPTPFILGKIMYYITARKESKNIN